MKWYVVAFMNSDMVSEPGYEIQEEPTTECWLKNAIYGLKQSP